MWEFCTFRILYLYFTFHAWFGVLLGRSWILMCSRMVHPLVWWKWTDISDGLVVWQKYTNEFFYFPCRSLWSNYDNVNQQMHSIRQNYNNVTIRHLLNVSALTGPSAGYSFSHFSGARMQIVPFVCVPCNISKTTIRIFIIFDITLHEIFSGNIHFG